MLHKNVVEEKNSGMVDHPLPSRANLPHWTRLNTLDTARYPRHFEKDEQAYPTDPVLSGPRSMLISEDEKPGYNEDVVHEKKKEAAGSHEVDSSRRIQYLERSIEMLKKQHCEILQSLHQEIDDLKRQNKDLNFKIIMSQKDSKSSLAADISGTNGDGGNDDGKTTLTEGQRRRETGERTDGGDGDDDDDDDDDGDKHGDGVDDSGGGGGQQRLRPQSVDRREERERSVSDLPEGERSDLSDLGDLADGRKLSDLTDTALGQQLETQNRELKLDKEEKLDELKILLLEEELKKLKKHNSYMSQLLEQSEDNRRHQVMIIESLQFQLTQYGVKFHDTKFANHHMTIHPYANVNTQTNYHLSILELQNMVKDLQQVNDSQSHELEALKSDLRDVLYSHKWTPDAYLIAKAYIAFDDAKIAQKDVKPLRSTPKLLSKKELEDRGAASVSDNLTLPPLKQTVGNAAVERRKRTRTMQKRRLKDKEAMF